MNVPPSTPVLQVQDLSFSYPGRPVFTGWSADFHAGLTWVRGSNGTGKSTLLKLLAGALPPLAGRIAVLVEGRGLDQAAAPLDYRREVFWCGPAAIAFDHLRPPEYFAFLLSLYPSFDGVAAQATAADLGLTPFMGKRLRELSTGTQRKVWLTAAFAAGTAVVLLDEPLNALDMVSVRKVRGHLQRCAQDARTAWVVVSHDGLFDAAQLGQPGQVEPAVTTLTLDEPAPLAPA
jgi:ABC-type multidrug transport system ATPase subunit